MLLVPSCTGRHSVFNNMKCIANNTNTCWGTALGLGSNVVSMSPCKFYWAHETTPLQPNQTRESHPS